ncbi:hypothetical protein [Streptomyces actuosus]|nr:hypothetical protein [Streptomyces actuosus]
MKVRLPPGDLAWLGGLAQAARAPPGMSRPPSAGPQAVMPP